MTCRRLARCAVLLILCAPPALAESVRVGPFDFALPGGWQAMPAPSPIRKAQIRVPDAAGGADGVVIFYHFGAGRGGTPDANIERWRNHFRDPRDRAAARIEVLREGENRTILFRAEGALDGGGGQVLRDYGLIAAIVRSKEGDVFVRFTAPAPLAQQSADAFRRMVLSAFEAR